MRVVVRVLVVAFVAIAGVLGPGSSAHAHVRDSTGYSTLTHRGNVVDYLLELPYVTLAKAVGLDDEALTTSDDRVRTTALTGAREQLHAYLDERVVVRADGVACDASLNGLAMTRREKLPFAEIDLTYRCPTATPASYTVEYSVFRFEEGVIDGHTNIVDHALNDTGRTERVVLDRGHTSFSTGQGSWLASAWQFAQLGFTYLLGGLDHILFILALAIGARTLRALGENVVVFTAAHAIALLAAAMDWVWLPPSIVEPLIALSVAFVALDGLMNRSRHRLWSVAAFGLLHGLAFAGALRVDGGASWHFLGSLFSFTLGIEAAQLLLLAVAVPIVVLLRRFPPRWSALATVTVTCLVAAVGLLWFAEHLTAPIA